MRPERRAALAAPATVTGFDHADAALTAVAARREALARAATVWQRQGRLPTDQDHASELLALCPANASARPLLLLGGMGPLAGLDGFAAASRRLGDRREIVLNQACHLPCRSRAIQGHQRPQLVAGLVEAIRLGASEVRGTGGLDLLVLCNTAHHFLPDALARLAQLDPPLARRVSWLSLIETAVAECRRTCRRVVVLASDGSRRTALYTGPLQAAGVACADLDERRQDLLNRAITDGVKAMNLSSALAWGGELCRRLAGDGAPDGILAGCTEVPVILDLVQRKGPAAARVWLDGLRIIDPVALVLDRLALDRPADADLVRQASKED